MTRETKAPEAELMVETTAGDGFLSRWSRRKREIAAETATPDPVTTHDASVSAEADEKPADLELATEQAVREKQELDELIARLPSVENIAKDTDVTGFLDARIPDVLRNAALRAAWSADPAIRDFLNDAREYALDYNTPGAAYGYGPLTESDLDLKAMVHQIFGDAPKVEKPDGELEDAPDSDKLSLSTSENSDRQREISDIGSQPEITAPQQEFVMESVRRSEPALNISKQPQIQPDMTSDNYAALQHQMHDVTLTTSNTSGFQRRGGRATPA